MGKWNSYTGNAAKTYAKDYSCDRGLLHFLSVNQYTKLKKYDAADSSVRDH